MSETATTLVSTYHYDFNCPGCGKRYWVDVNPYEMLVNSTWAGIDCECGTTLSIVPVGPNRVGLVSASASQRSLCEVKDGEPNQRPT